MLPARASTSSWCTPGRYHQPAGQAGQAVQRHKSGCPKVANMPNKGIASRCTPGLYHQTCKAGQAVQRHGIDNFRPCGNGCNKVGEQDTGDRHGGICAAFSWLPLPLGASRWPLLSCCSPCCYSLQLYLWLSYGRPSCEHPMPALPPQVCLTWKRGGPGPSLLTSHTSSGPLSVLRGLRRWGWGAGDC